MSDDIVLCFVLLKGVKTKRDVNFPLDDFFMSLALLAGASHKLVRDDSTVSRLLNHLI